MGSGVFIATVIVAWFVILVPMVLTRRDTAWEMAARENDLTTARVLRRGRDLRADRLSRRRITMSRRETSHSPEYGDAAYDEDVVDTAVHARIVDREPAQTPRAAHEAHDDTDAPADAHRGHRRTDDVREKLLARRRQTLLTLLALVVVTTVIAIFAGSWTWALAGASSVVSVGYLVHLRAEARREEERRLTREVRANRAHGDVLGRNATGSQSSLATNAFVAAGITQAEVVALDDEDPALYDLADAPVADSVDLSGHDYYSEYQTGIDYDDYDYDSDDYGIRPQSGKTGDDDKWGMPRAV